MEVPMARSKNRPAGRWPYNNPSVFDFREGPNPRHMLDAYEQSPLTDEWGNLMHNGGHILALPNSGKEEDYD